MKKKRVKPVYEETVYPSIEQAYDELSQEGFAVWIRLMTMTSDQLCEGKRALGYLCNYSTGRFYRIMKELNCKDYVRYIKPKTLGRPHVVILHKRATIGGKNNFVRLRQSRATSDIQNILSEDIDCKSREIFNSDEQFQEKTPNAEPVDEKQKNSNEDSENKNNAFPGAVSRKRLMPKGRRKYVKHGDCDVPLDEIIENDAISLSPVTPLSLKIKEISPSASRKGDSLTTSSFTKTRERENKKSKKKETALSKKLSQKYKAKRAEASAKRKQKKTIKTWKIDYSKLDSKGDPSISFDPKSTRRDELINILEAKTKGVTREISKKRKETKKCTEEKLAREFGRIYKRYRNLINESRNRKSRFIMPPSSEKYCAKIAIQCIYQEITPRQLLEYWDANIKQFAQGTFRHPYPTLSFLSGSYAAEQVSTVLFEQTEGGNKKWKSGDFKKRKSTPPPTGAHSFFDTEELDAELKQGLLAAGFEIGPDTKYNDRYLLTIQKTAKAIANGKSIFVGGTMKAMVKWAAENLYNE